MVGVIERRVSSWILDNQKDYRDCVSYLKGAGFKPIGVLPSIQFHSPRVYYEKIREKVAEETGHNRLEVFERFEVAVLIWENTEVFFKPK